jgi:uncharacterized coiled-coil DUF342 family protein
MIGDILTGRLRTEMRQRVDEILKRGNEWNQTAGKLTEALNRLTDTIKESKFDPSNLKPMNKDLRKLSKTTIQLKMAFESYNKFLQEYLPRVLP